MINATKKLLYPTGIVIPWGIAVFVLSGFPSDLIVLADVLEVNHSMLFSQPREPPNLISQISRMRDTKIFRDIHHGEDIHVEKPLKQGNILELLQEEKCWE